MSPRLRPGLRLPPSPLLLSSLLCGALALSPSLARAQLDVPPEPPTFDQRPPQQPGQPPPPPARPATPPSSTAPPAREERGASSEEPSPNRYESKVTTFRPSPEWTQDRSFTSTRFWLLDPGKWEVETWWRTRIFDNPSQNPYEMLFQQEVEVGVAPHLQLDLYANFQFIAEDANGPHNLSYEGFQVEARIAIPSYYGQIFGNPVLYLEWHPRWKEPDRAEVRLLLGGAPTRWLYIALNPYVETNVEATDSYSAQLDAKGNAQLVKSSKFIADMEFGSTVAVGLRITDWFRVSAEAKIGADMLGDENNKLHFVAFVGPGFILKPLKSERLKIMGTCLFGVAGQSEGAQRFEPLLIVASGF